MSQKQIKNKGFSLIETLVAVTVLLIAIAGPMTIAHRALSDANIAKNQTIANFLAQDALEYIKNIRDENNINGNNWDATISSCSGICTIDSAQDDISVCSGTCPILREDPNSGLYGYNGAWNPTPFTRTITISSINEREISVSVDISWQNGTVSRSISLKENILNWHGEDSCTNCF